MTGMGIAGLMERVARTRFSQAEKKLVVVAWGGLGEGNGGEKREEAEGERAAKSEVHADFLAERLSGMAGRELLRYGAGEIVLSYRLSVGIANVD
jgi:hypothetical protein